jgi:hypothetical protein
VPNTKPFGKSFLWRDSVVVVALGDVLCKYMSSIFSFSDPMSRLSAGCLPTSDVLIAPILLLLLLLLPITVMLILSISTAIIAHKSSSFFFHTMLAMSTESLITRFSSSNVMDLSSLLFSSLVIDFSPLLFSSLHSPAPDLVMNKNSSPTTKYLSG